MAKVKPLLKRGELTFCLGDRGFPAEARNQVCHSRLVLQRHQRDNIAVRVGNERYEESLNEANVRRMDFTGRPMKGYVFVESAGCDTDVKVRRWAKLGVRFVATLNKSTVSVRPTQGSAP